MLSNLPKKCKDLITVDGMNYHLTIYLNFANRRICLTNLLSIMIAILQDWGRFVVAKNFQYFLPFSGEFFYTFFMSENTTHSNNFATQKLLILKHPRPAGSLQGSTDQETGKSPISTNTLPRTLISGLKLQVGQTVLLKCFLHKKRVLSKNLLFLVLRDRTGLVQILLENFEEIAKLEGLQTGTILSLTGQVVAESKAVGGVEIHEPKLEIVVRVLEPSPIEIDKDLSHENHNFDTLFDYRILGLRNLKEQVIFRISASIADVVRAFLKQSDFLEFRSPKLLAEATEGGAEVFRLKYFDKEATLAQSAQFYKQIMVGVCERAFEIGATYRAEPSFGPRHMTEFTTLDVEMGFIDNFEEVLNLAGDLIKFVSNTVFAKNTTELELWQAQKPLLPEKIPQITMQNLHELYWQETGRDLRFEKDPSPEEERFICEYAKLNWHSEAVFITEFPSSDMKFYHYKNEQNPTVCDRADLIFRGVEIATLTRREHRFERLIGQMKEFGLNPEATGYQAYLMAFRHGLPPHGGFGLGLERLTQKLIGLGSVKEATLFPRDVRRLGP